MAKEDPAKLEALRSAASVDARGSPLYRWMWDNYSDFSDIVNARRPNWRGITNFFTSQGFVGADGKELRPTSVVQTWMRVKRRREPPKPRKRAKPAGIKADVVTEVVADVNAVSDVNRSLNRSPVICRPRVTPGMPISPVFPGVPARSVEPAQVRDEKVDPDEVMRKLTQQMNAGRLKMPDPIK